MKKRVRTMLLAVLTGLPLYTGTATADTLDDATIFAIFDQANTIDIWMGRLGAAYGKSDAVRALGKMTASDHESVQQMGRDLAKKLGITPTPPPHDATARNHAATLDRLQAKQGKDFDIAYLQNELAFHQSVIDAVKKTLLPAIHNAEFKALVETVLPGFEHHLAETRSVANQLGIK